MSKTTQFLAVLATLVPLTALASSVVVPPPAPPGQEAAPQVIPPAGVASALPAAYEAPLAAPAPSVPPAPIDVALPAAPPAPETEAVSVPKKSSKSAKKEAGAREIPQEVVDVAVEADPFAGLVSTPVSDSQLNRFTFPEPVEGIYFAEGAPLPECPEGAAAQDPCKPVFLNGKRMMLLQLRAGAKGPVQMLVHLHSGRVVTLNLMPKAGPGAVVRVDDAEDGPSDARLAATDQDTAEQAAYKHNLNTLQRLARGDIPAGFEATKVGGVVRFEHFEAVPLATWSDGNKLRAHMFQLRAYGDTPVAVAPGLFRNSSVLAVALDTDTLTASAPATLLILEQVQGTD